MRWVRAGWQFFTELAVHLFFTYFVLALLVSPAEAMVTEFRTVMQECGLTSCRQFQNVGTAVTIGRYRNGWLHVSSGHHLQGGKLLTAKLGTWDGYTEAHLIGWVLNRDNDLSLWYTGPIDDWKAIPLADRDASVGDRVTQWTRGSGQYNKLATEVTGLNKKTLSTRLVAKEGDSGSAVVKDHKLVGVVWGKSDGIGSVSIPVSLVCRTIKGWLPGFSCCRPPARPVQPEPAEIVIDYDKLADALLERMARDERFRGPQGPPGESGVQGPPGDCPDIGDLRAEIDELKAHKRRVVLVKDGKIVDDEEYGFGEPIVLDFKKIQKASQ